MFIINTQNVIHKAIYFSLQISGKFVSDHEKPGPFICMTAKKEGATYVVMGTRGLGKLKRTVMGSVSDHVVHHSECPVFVYRVK